MTSSRAARGAQKLMKNVGENVVRIEAEALRALADRLAGPMAADFDRAVELLYSCAGRIVVTGMGKSGLIARKIAATLTSTGSPALFLHPAEAMHGDLGMVVRGDIVLALSASGETGEILQLLATVKRLGVPLITMTCDELHVVFRRTALVFRKRSGAPPWSEGQGGSNALYSGSGRRRRAGLLGRPGSLLAWTGADRLNDHHARPGRRAGGRALRAPRIQRRRLCQSPSRRQAGQAFRSCFVPDAQRRWLFLASRRLRRWGR